jgi:NDP-sugar pyrophosphorylase family protein
LSWSCVREFKLAFYCTLREPFFIIYTVYMNILRAYTPYIHDLFPHLQSPWQLTDQLDEVLMNAATKLNEDYEVQGTCYIHKTADVHPTVITQGIVIIGANASIGPHVLLRAGVWIGEGAHIGGSSEIKQSLVGPGSAVAHLNYVGNSVLGAQVNIEAGAVLAVHYNERDDKRIMVLVEGELIETGVEKFGALVGDHSKIGANSVTAPGTILKPKSVVGRLELIQQIPE